MICILISQSVHHFGLVSAAQLSWYLRYCDLILSLLLILIWVSNWRSSMNIIHEPAKPVLQTVGHQLPNRNELSIMRNHPYNIVFMPQSQWFMMSSNVNIFRVTGPCAGNSPVTGEYPLLPPGFPLPRRPVTRRFDVFFDLSLKKGFSKQSKRRWFETSSCPLWCHCNVLHKMLLPRSDLIIPNIVYMQVAPLYRLSMFQRPTLQLWCFVKHSQKRFIS